MTPYYSDSAVTIYCGDCRDILPSLDPVETCITDPPYGLGFMGKDWDKFSPGDSPMRRRAEVDAVNAGASRQGGRQRACSDYQKRQARDMRAFQDWCEEWAVLLLDALLPGASLLAFGGTRTFHRLTCAIEDAGFEVRDCLMWLYGSGFPKSLDISKALDKAAGAEREVVGPSRRHAGRSSAAAPVGDLARYGDSGMVMTAPASEAAKLWRGWGTALKPAWEPIVLAMKPLAGTFAQNALTHGVAGLNVDGARIPAESGGAYTNHTRKSSPGWQPERTGERTDHAGRWPANLVLDEDAAAMLDEQSGERTSGMMRGGTRRAAQDGPGSVCYGTYGGDATEADTYADRGGASRFFYTAKASRSDRGPDNDHPTVKPSDLMKWLVTLTATPTGGTVLDPFMGSGTTVYAAKEMGRCAIGIDVNEAYCEIAARRCAQEVLAL